MITRSTLIRSCIQLLLLVYWVFIGVQVSTVSANCSESLLLGVSIDNCSSCSDDIDGAASTTVRGGCVSLASGPSSPAAPVPGAVATYTCCDGYEPLLGGGVLTALECMPDGNWNGTPPVCVAEEAGSPSATVIGLAVGLALAIALAVAIGVYSCVSDVAIVIIARKKERSKAKLEEGASD